MPAIRIEFEDRGQDFLWWTLEEIAADRFRVTACGPSQDWLWKDKQVVGTVRVNKHPIVVLAGEERRLHYRITKVTHA